MITEYEKMMAGELFNPADKCFMWMMMHSELIQRALNRTPLWNQARRDRLLKSLFGSINGRPYCVYMPLHAVYGCNIHVGKNFFANYNLTLQDYAPITIGDDVWFGPNVVITTVTHPTDPLTRDVKIIPHGMQSGNRGNLEYARPVSIGNNVVVYSGVIICPGVTIGNNTIIGAGSVVTKDIPANVVAYGNPCRAIRAIN